jgi:hypothetical protein
MMKSADLRLTTATIVIAVLCLPPLSAGASGAVGSTPQDVFDGMRASFQAGKAKGVHAGYQWHLSGPKGGEWWIKVNNGTFQMGMGVMKDPSVIFVVSDKDWVALSDGRLGGTWAYLTGRLKIRGDRGLAKKLGEIFP